MKRISFSFLFLFLISSYSLAQYRAADTAQKVVIFAPLYLDSAFDVSQTYRYPANAFPKFINPGLEFYEGAKLALDSMQKEGANLEVFIYDTRSAKESLQQQLNRSEIADAGLIIAYCSGNELRTLAEAALVRKIPVINVNVPNDGGAVNNPNFIVLNPTLLTQCEGIYNYLSAKFSSKNIVVFRRSGTADNSVQSIFANYARQTQGKQVKLKYVDLPPAFTLNDLSIDTTGNTVYVAGSLDVSFGKKLSSTMASGVKQIPVTLIGMPTWDAIKDFSKSAYKNLRIIYSAPFYVNNADRISKSIGEYFKTKLYARPTDVVFKGYEITWKYAKLLMQYKRELSSNIGRKDYQIFTSYDVQPVINRSTTVLDYYENKNLYFLGWTNGTLGLAY